MNLEDREVGKGRMVLDNGYSNGGGRLQIHKSVKCIEVYLDVDTIEEKEHFKPRAEKGRNKDRGPPRPFHRQGTLS